MSERRPLRYTESEQAKRLYKSSPDAIANAGVIWWPQNHEIFSENDEMIPFFNRNLDRSRGDVVLVEGYPHRGPVVNVFDSHVEAYGWEINPKLLVLNEASHDLSNRAAEQLVDGMISDDVYDEVYADFLDSCVLRTKHSLVPSMNDVWERHPDARIGVVAGLTHVISDKSMTIYLSPEEQEIVREHKLVSEEQSLLAQTMNKHGGFVILGEPYDFGSLRLPVPQPNPPAPPRHRRWL